MPADFFLVANQVWVGPFFKLAFVTAAERVMENFVRWCFMGSINILLAVPTGIGQSGELNWPGFIRGE